MKIKVTNISWDTGKENLKLPKTAVLDFNNDMRYRQLYTPVATALSDKFDHYFFKMFDYEVIGDHEEERIAALKMEIKQLKGEPAVYKKRKVYTAAVCLHDITGKNGEDDFDFRTGTFDSEETRQAWIDDTTCEIVRNAIGEEGVDYTISETTSEQELDIPTISTNTKQPRRNNTHV